MNTKHNSVGRFGAIVIGLIAFALLATACSESSDDQATDTTTPATTTTSTQAPATTAATSTAAPATTTTETPFSLDEVVTRAVIDDTIPGLAATVFTSSEILDQASAGVRQNGGSDALTTQDRFHIGSNTKAITAALIGRLVEQDLLEFDSTLGDIFDELPTVDPQSGAVTVRQLLSHTAGIDDALVVESDVEYDEGAQPTTQRAEALAWLIARPTNHAPGGEWMYSNVGYALVGAVAEEVTGSSFTELIDKEVFEPLGITTCEFGTPTDEAGQPLGHDGANEPVPLDEVLDLDILSPAGSVTYCSMDGWVRFLQEMMRAHNGASDWLSAETAHEIVEPVAQDYALGWGVVADEDSVAFAHDGSNTLNYSTTWITPGDDIGWIVVTNASGNPGGLAASFVAYQIGVEYGEL